MSNSSRATVVKLLQPKDIAAKLLGTLLSHHSDSPADTKETDINLMEEIMGYLSARMELREQKQTARPFERKASAEDEESEDVTEDVKLKKKYIGYLHLAGFALEETPKFRDCPIDRIKSIVQQVDAIERTNSAGLSDKSKEIISDSYYELFISLPVVQFKFLVQSHNQSSDDKALNHLVNTEAKAVAVQQVIEGYQNSIAYELAATGIKPEDLKEEIIAQLTSETSQFDWVKKIVDEELGEKTVSGLISAALAAGAASEEQAIQCLAEQIVEHTFEKAKNAFTEQYERFYQPVLDAEENNEILRMENAKKHFIQLLERAGFTLFEIPPVLSHSREIEDILASSGNRIEQAKAYYYDKLSLTWNVAKFKKYSPEVRIDTPDKLHFVLHVMKKIPAKESAAENYIFKITNEIFMLLFEGPKGGRLIDKLDHIISEYDDAVGKDLLNHWHQEFGKESIHKLLIEILCEVMFKKNNLTEDHFLLMLEVIKEELTHEWSEKVKTAVAEKLTLPQPFEAKKVAESKVESQEEAARLFEQHLPLDRFDAITHLCSHHSIEAWPENLKTRLTKYQQNVQMLLLMAAEVQHFSALKIQFEEGQKQGQARLVSAQQQLALLKKQAMTLKSNDAISVKLNRISLSLFACAESLEQQATIVKDSSVTFFQFARRKLHDTQARKSYTELNFDLARMGQLDEETVGAAAELFAGFSQQMAPDKTIDKVAGVLGQFASMLKSTESELLAAIHQSFEKGVRRIESELKTFIENRVNDVLDKMADRPQAKADFEKELEAELEDQVEKFCNTNRRNIERCFEVLLEKLDALIKKSGTDKAVYFSELQNANGELIHAIHKLRACNDLVDQADKELSALPAEIAAKLAESAAVVAAAAAAEKKSETTAKPKIPTLFKSASRHLGHSRSGSAGVFSGVLPEQDAPSVEEQLKGLIDDFEELINPASSAPTVIVTNSDKVQPSVTPSQAAAMPNQDVIVSVEVGKSKPILPRRLTLGQDAKKDMQVITRDLPKQRATLNGPIASTAVVMPPKTIQVPTKPQAPTVPKRPAPKRASLPSDTTIADSAQPKLFTLFAGSVSQLNSSAAGTNAGDSKTFSERKSTIVGNPLESSAGETRLVQFQRIIPEDASREAIVNFVTLFTKEMKDFLETVPEQEQPDIKKRIDWAEKEAANILARMKIDPKELKKWLSYVHKQFWSTVSARPSRGVDDNGVPLNRMIWSKDPKFTRGDILGKFENDFNTCLKNATQAINSILTNLLSSAKLNAEDYLAIHACAYPVVTGQAKHPAVIESEVILQELKSVSLNLDKPKEMKEQVLSILNKLAIFSREKFGAVFIPKMDGKIAISYAPIFDRRMKAVKLAVRLHDVKNLSEQAKMFVSTQLKWMIELNLNHPGTHGMLDTIINDLRAHAKEHHAGLRSAVRFG